MLLDEGVCRGDRRRGLKVEKQGGSRICEINDALSMGVEGKGMLEDVN